MSRSRSKHTGRRESGSFFAIPHAVMHSPNWRAMPARTVKLVCDVGAQYTGSNNGNLCAAWRVMHPLGWGSKETLALAIADALRFGMLEKTRQGGLHMCSLYALTWRAIDECGGKLDVPATRIPSGLWKLSPATHEKQNASTDSVPRNYGFRTYGRQSACA